MTSDQLKKALALIEQARLAKPLLSAALDAMLNDFGPELARALRAANDFLLGEKARSVRFLEAEGFSREEALLLVCDAEAARQRLMRQLAARPPAPRLVPASKPAPAGTPSLAGAPGARKE